MFRLLRTDYVCYGIFGILFLITLPVWSSDYVERKSNAVTRVSPTSRLARRIVKRQVTPGVSGLTDVQKEDSVKKHNELRRLRPASDMEYMIWNDYLADMSQEWAEACDFVHGQPARDPDTMPFRSVGQNLYFNTGGLNVNHSIVRWHDEITDYDYVTGQCNGPMCGHYTQLVWASSREVGCGFHLCPELKDSDFGKTYKNGYYYVCAYGPAGNFVGEKPYKEGPPCSSCPTGKQWCDKVSPRGLCRRDCNGFSDICDCGAVCNNCGTQTDQCTCNCTAGWSGQDCSRECKNYHPNCGQSPGWPAFTCNMDGFGETVRGYCPELCNLCTKADANTPQCTTIVTQTTVTQSQPSTPVTEPSTVTSPLPSTVVTESTSVTPSQLSSTVGDSSTVRSSQFSTASSTVTMSQLSTTVTVSSTVTPPEPSTIVTPSSTVPPSQPSNTLTGESTTITSSQASTTVTEESTTITSSEPLSTVAPSSTVTKSQPSITVTEKPSTVVTSQPSTRVTTSQPLTTVTEESDTVTSSQPSTRVTTSQPSTTVTEESDTVTASQPSTRIITSQPLTTVTDQSSAVTSSQPSTKVTTSEPSTTVTPPSTVTPSQPPTTLTPSSTVTPSNPSSTGSQSTPSPTPVRSTPSPASSSTVPVICSEITCLNGGHRVDNGVVCSCRCTTGWQGPRCQHRSSEALAGVIVVIETGNKPWSILWPALKASLHNTVGNFCQRSGRCCPNGNTHNRTDNLHITLGRGYPQNNGSVTEILVYATTTNIADICKTTAYGESADYVLAQKALLAAIPAADLQQSLQSCCNLTLLDVRPGRVVTPPTPAGPSDVALAIPLWVIITVLTAVNLVLISVVLFMICACRKKNKKNITRSAKRSIISHNAPDGIQNKAFNSIVFEETAPISPGVTPRDSGKFSTFKTGTSGGGYDVKKEWLP